NLVLTKPINIEQSKGTLRVARGLLRKNDAKPASVGAPLKTFSEPSPASQDAINTASADVKPNAFTESASAPVAPFSALEVEPDPTPETEAAELAVLESLPQLAGHSTDQAGSSVPRNQAELIGAGSSGQAAAVAPALEKTEMAIGLKSGTMPMVTNEPIVSDAHFDTHAETEAPERPVFSSLELGARSSGVGTKFFKAALIFAVAFTAGYFSWQKLRPIQYLQHLRAQHVANTSTAPVQTPAPSMEPASASPAPRIELPAPEEDEISASQTSGSNNEKSDTIEVQELPMSGDTKNFGSGKTPLIVKPDIAVKKNLKSTPTPPPVQVSSVNSSDSGISSLAASTPAIPQLAPTSLRVSQGVSQGLILKKVAPSYPPMALQLRKQGTVELLATISKRGVITDVKVISGEAMLAKPAVDAVRQWKYRPYLLNGEPVDIQTQITINFKSPR
ncbi:MAG TPA: energy transducer TonB, partial [Terriglobales bacterium]|nr:energy transducer TonB [Terriglobales bacterium]